MGLTIRMFGSFAVSTTSTTSLPSSVGNEDMRETLMQLPHLMEAVLAYLVLNKRPCSRDNLLEAFWSDCTLVRARRCLNTTLWRLRCALEPETIAPGTYLISSGNDEVGFNTNSDTWVDVHQFVQGVSPILNQSMATVDATSVAHAKQALALYRAELLEGFFDDWVIREREHLARLYLDTLGQLVVYHRLRKEPEVALGFARQVLQIEPLREDIHREVMQQHLALGRRSDALKQFEACKAILHQELGIEPMLETTSLYRSILSCQASAQTSDDHAEFRHVDSLVAAAGGRSAMATASGQESNLRELLRSTLRTLEDLQARIHTLLECP